MLQIAHRDVRVAWRRLRELAWAGYDLGGDRRLEIPGRATCPTSSPQLRCRLLIVSCVAALLAPV
jgi:hypothetical protein